jgi:hypothetical protein
MPQRYSSLTKYSSRIHSTAIPSGSAAGVQVLDGDTIKRWLQGVLSDDADHARR